MIQQIVLTDDGTFPNNARLPLLLYSGALRPLVAAAPASCVEERFNSNRWPAAWRNGVYSVHHYHSKAHEALGVYSGWSRIQFGGPDGPVVRVEAGDAAVLPAGTAHKLVEAGPGFAVVGAYPPGQHPDMCYGRPGERPGADQRITQMTIPESDPILGEQGGLLDIWNL